MKTIEQIQQAVENLQALRDALPKTSLLGEPIHEGIDAQLKVLELALLDGSDSYENDFVYNCAVDAIDWVDTGEDAELADSWRWALEGA